MPVITNIGTSHIEFLGSREGICKAKLEILEGLQEGGAAVLCGDEPLLWDKREQPRLQGRTPMASKILPATLTCRLA